jgi:excinuclease ABC subunit A
MCPDCNGLGYQLQVDPDLIITRPHLSLLDGASPLFGELRKKSDSWTSSQIHAIAEHYQADLELPWQELPETMRQTILYGTGGQELHFKYENRRGTFSGEVRREYEGAIRQTERFFRQTRSDYRRRTLGNFMSQQPCPTCQGERLCPAARFVTAGGQRLPQVLEMNIRQAQQWVGGLQFADDQAQVAEELIKEVGDRLQFMLNVGLHYLTLNRNAPTLSGGESQRIRLASQLGCGLVGVIYILDEPSIGLHARDHRALLDTLLQLRDMGNTVVVIEHDAATMHDADWLIDLGPDAGVLGGELIAAGTPQKVMADPRSITGHYLSGKKQISSSRAGRRQATGWLTLRGARLHNLHDIDVDFPLGVFSCVSGVSGSGKSSLVRQTMYPALARALHNAQTVPGPYREIEGLELVDKVINITQDPIGRTPRSNPATYVGVFSEIRKLFASLPEAKARGYKAGRFSFNVQGGRCDTCRGHGRKRVEMHFLPDVWVTCAACSGSRYNRQTLEVTYHGRSIAGVLEMEVQEALEFFAPHPKIARVLQTLDDVGLEYIRLGQSALTLSGGEAQRVKLAKELSRVAVGNTVYILDEPTTGLHFADIQRLLDVLQRLVDSGNTIIVIEHNLDVMQAADYIIDLGPEGGDAGGTIVAQGTPEQLAQEPTSYTGQFLSDMVKTGR